MRVRVARSLTLLVALSASAQGCTPDFPEPFWKGAFLEYASTVDNEVCAGSWVVQDQYVGMLADLLGVTLESPLNYAYISETERDEYCFAPDLLGCYYEGKAYSKYAVHFHELAHGVAAAGGIKGPEAFQEGLAEVFGNGQYSDDERRPALDILMDFDHKAGSYYTAGLFVRFLIERHDIGRLLDFMRQTNEESSWEKTRDTFQSVFQEPLEDVVLEFEAYPACSMWNNRIALTECRLAEVPWNGDVWEVSTELECTDSDVLGPVPDGDKNIQWTTRGMVVDTDGDYLVAVEPGPTGEAGVRITRCASCLDSVDVLVRAGDSRAVSLTSGRYYVTFIQEAEEPEGLAVSLTRMP